jgi:Bacterial extracellular solute-binding proteins, family 5 Middle
MRLRACLWLALSSFPAGLLLCETRPHYGGTLNVDLSTAFNSLDADATPRLLWRLVAQTLVRINARGEAEPLLASSWQREADGRRWRISLRTDVRFHDGEALNAGNVAPILLAALKKAHPDAGITAGGSTMVIQSEGGLPNLVTELADPRMAIVRSSENNSLIGTGPFRVTSWEPSRRLTLAAFEDYWGGRPFLDSVIVNLASARVTADVFDIPFKSPRRIVPEAARIWQSAPKELLALVAQSLRPELVQALALAIDRSPILNVLAQRRGTAAYGLLPLWLSGYEFLFETVPNTARARELVTAVRPAPIALNYQLNDSFARAISDRIALNGRDVGMTLQPSPGGGGALRLVRCTLESPDAALELTSVAQCLGVEDRIAPLDMAKPENLYQAERVLLDSNRVIPLVHLESVYGLAPRVHYRDPGIANPITLHIDDLWVDP